MGYATVPMDLVPRFFFTRDMFMVVEADVVYERCRQMKTQCFASRKALERSGNFSEVKKMVHKGLTQKTQESKHKKPHSSLGGHDFYTSMPPDSLCAVCQETLHTSLSFLCLTGSSCLPPLSLGIRPGVVKGSQTTRLICQMVRATTEASQEPGRS